AADAALDQRAQHDLRRLLALLAGPRADDVDRLVEGVGVAQRGDVRERPEPQLRVLVALHRGDQEAALQLAAAVEVEHRARPAPAVRRDTSSGERRPQVLLAVVEVLDRDPPQLALEDREAALLLRADGEHPALDPHAPPAPAANRADHDRAAAVDVAVEQRVQRDDRIVVLGGGVDEVDHQPRLLAGVPARDAPDALLVDALGGGG